MQEIVWGRLKPGHCIKDYSHWYMGFLLNKLIYRGTPNCAVIVVKGSLKVKGKTNHFASYNNAFVTSRYCSRHPSEG